MKGATKTYVQREHIIHKGEIIASCYFSASVIGPGAGFNCESIFSDEAMLSRFMINRADLIPSNQRVFYPSNKLGVEVDYSITGVGTQDSFELAYLAECPSSVSDEPSTSFGKIPVSVDYQDSKTANFNVVGAVLGGKIEVGQTGAAHGKTFVNLFKVPSFGLDGPDENSVFSLDLTKIDGVDSNSKGCEIEFSSLSSENKVNFNIKETVGFKFNPGFTSSIVSSTETGGAHPIDLTSNNLNIYFNGNYGGKLAANLICNDDKDDKKSFGTFDDSFIGVSNSDNFANLKSGPCKLNLKLLPVGSGITATGFKDFSLGNMQQDDIIVDSKLATLGEMEPLDFIINERSSDPTVYFDLLTPFQKQNYCIERNGIDEIMYPLKIAVNFMAQKPNNEAVKITEFSYSLSNERRGGTLKQDEVTIDNKNYFLITISPKELNTYLGTDFNIDAEFNYKITIENEKQLVGTIPITISTANSCSVTSLNQVFCSEDEYRDGDTCKKKTTAVVETAESCYAKRPSQILDSNGNCKPCEGDLVTPDGKICEKKKEGDGIFPN